MRTLSVDGDAFVRNGDSLSSPSQHTPTMALVQRFLVLVLFALLGAAQGLRIGSACGRRSAVAGAAALFLRPAQPALAGDGKDDKAFQTCLSQCVYETTKITKGIGQVEVTGRAEAFAMCKPKYVQRRFEPLNTLAEPLSVDMTML